MKKSTLILLLILALCACSKGKNPHSNGVVAEWNTHVLTLSDIRSITNGLNPIDSARVAEEYIRQWATDLIEYERAKDVPNKEIERLSEDYRHSLYIHEYEQQLISQRMSTEVADSLIVDFYTNHLNYFTLREPLIQGALLIVPNGAPHLDNICKILPNITDEQHLETLEKYAYQYAIGYELFLSDWRTGEQVLLRLPENRNKTMAQLATKKLIQQQDSLYTYLLQVIHYCPAGDKMPMEYAQKDIQDILLNEKRIDFIQQERIALYEQAKKDGKLIIYEQ